MVAHLRWDRASAFRVTPHRQDKPSTYLLGRSMEDAAARLADLGGHATTADTLAGACNKAQPAVG